MVDIIVMDGLGLRDNQRKGEEEHTPHSCTSQTSERNGGQKKSECDAGAVVAVTVNTRGGSLQFHSGKLN